MKATLRQQHKQTRLLTRQIFKGCRNIALLPEYRFLYKGLPHLRQPELFVLPGFLLQERLPKAGASTTKSCSEGRTVKLIAPCCLRVMFDFKDAIIQIIIDFYNFPVVLYMCAYRNVQILLLI